MGGPGPRPVVHFPGSYSGGMGVAGGESSNPAGKILAVEKFGVAGWRDGFLRDGFGQREDEAK